jgi:hypothetical protein
MDSVTQQHYQALADEPIDTSEQATGNRAEALAGFEAIPRWACLNVAIRSLSDEFRHAFGSAAWLLAGGDIDDDGYASFRNDSKLGAEITQHFCHYRRRFRYRDESGLPWAIVALNTDGSFDSQALALGGPSSGFLFDASTPPSNNCHDQRELDHVRGEVHSEPQPGRSQEEPHEDQLFSNDTAAALPNVLRAVIAQQKSDRITIDELHVAGLLWGENSELWPRRWRKRLDDALSLFDSLQLREVKVSAGRWRPILASPEKPWHSVQWIRSTELEINLNPLLVPFLSF